MHQSLVNTKLYPEARIEFQLRYHRVNCRWLTTGLKAKSCHISIIEFVR